MRRPAGFAVGVVVLLSLLPIGVAPVAGASQAAPIPAFDAKNFSNSTTINNPYFPLSPGTTFVYDGFDKGKGHPEHNEVTVTSETKKILGVKCIVVVDQVWVDGELVEDTVDWYAQDNAGNVWYMGEFTTDYEGGVVVGHEGSWEAGVDGAQPGYIMEAQPVVGDIYQQEYYPGVAEDFAQVLSVSASVSIASGSWQGNVLQTQETNPLEKNGIGNKYYAPGVGEVMEESVKGGSGHMELTEIRFG